MVRCFKTAGLRITPWLLSGAFAAACFGAGGTVAWADSKKPVETVHYINTAASRIDVRVVLNKSETVKVAFPFGEALVANSDIADVVPLTNQSINILGKKIGVTRLSLVDGRRQVLGIVDIEVAHDVTALRELLHSMPDCAGIRVNSVNGKFLLTGEAPNAAVSTRVAMLAEQFAPGDVTNAMSVAGPQQVMLEVRFIEAQRTAARGLGVNWAMSGPKIGGITGNNNLLNNSNNGSTPQPVITASPNGYIASSPIYNVASGLGNNLVPFGTLTGAVLNGGVKADVFVSALEQAGLARKLAEPNLVALSGDTASFLAGGEFPFPVAGPNNTITTEFKKYGIGLAFTPTVLAGRQINLRIEPEVSEIDNSAAVNINGVQVPGLSVRRASTTVELRDGQSFAIAGLLQGSHLTDKQGLPWIDDVPVMGALFRSQSFQKQETDLVIIVTPRLVKPKIPGEKLATPLDNTAPANDPEFFLNGTQEVKTVKPPHQEGQGHIIDYSWTPAATDGDKGMK
jgi:pilus assembly protein CpaC